MDALYVHMFVAFKLFLIGILSLGVTFIYSVAAFALFAEDFDNHKSQYCESIQLVLFYVYMYCILGSFQGKIILLFSWICLQPQNLTTKKCFDPLSIYPQKFSYLQ